MQVFRRTLGLILVIAVMTSMLAAQAPPTQPVPPQFSTAIERLPVDVTVVDGNGRQVTDLTAADFQVSVDGTSRRVETAAWLSLTGPANTRDVAPALPAGFTSNQHAVAGRLIVIVVDQASISFGGTPVAREAVTRFVDRLSPDDLVAAIGLGMAAPSTPFTRDRTLLKNALARMNGQRQTIRTVSRHHIDLTTALADQRGDTSRIDRIIKRDCENEPTVGAQQACAGEVRAEAAAMVVPAVQEGEATLRGLEALLTGLAGIDAPKTVVFVSEGFVTDGVSQGAMSGRIADVGALATAAQATFYALYLDEQALEIESNRGGIAQEQSSPQDDRRLRRGALEVMVSSARGALFGLSGNSDAVFDRLTNETAGYYVLGVEATESDRGSTRSLRVTVSRAGLTVRARRTFGVGPATARAQRSPRDLVMGALTSPLSLSALPLRAATFSLQGSEAGKVQLLIRADIGERYNAAENVALAYLVVDSEGRMVATQSFGGRLSPAVDGSAGPLAYTAGASLAPGDYTLKLAAAVGETVGSIAHPVHAGLTTTGALTLSDLTVGGPVPIDTPTGPTVDPFVRFGAVHGYVEAYGLSAPDAKARFEIAADEQAPALVTQIVQPRPVGATRTIFNAMIPAGQLPPGAYRLRAVVSAGAAETVLSRAFEVPTNSRTPSTVTSSGDVPAPAALFLPVSAAELNSAFDLAEALKPATVAPLARDLPATVATLFESGLAALRKNDLPAADRSFKEAIQPDLDTTAAMAYLGVTYAAAGQDMEAAGIWQTALVDGGDQPQLYAWVGEALVRRRDLPGALKILEEGAQRWPDDARFARPLAMLYASLGRGREALPMLERHLAGGTPSPAVLAMGIEWIYRAHVDGVVLHSKAEDLALARRYADQYDRANGPRQPLVRQWLDYLSRP